MPLYELPLQRCGTGHWLTDPCPKGECDLLVFEKDTARLIPVKKERSLARGVVSEGESGHCEPSIGPVSVGGEAPQSDPVIRNLTDAEKAAARAKRYREKKKLEDPAYLERERERKRRQTHDPPSE